MADEFWKLFDPKELSSWSSKISLQQAGVVDAALLRRLAQGFEAGRRARALESAYQIEVPIAKLQATYDEAFSSSDRAAAIVVTSLVDDLLISTMGAHMRGASEAEKRHLFKRGPLGSNYARVTMARSLNWIDAKVAFGLRVMADVRNAFAHEVAVRSFHDVKVANEIEKMEASEAVLVTQILEQIPDFRLSPRKKFLARSSTYTTLMIHQLICSPFAHENQLDVQDMISGDTKQMPKHWRDLRLFGTIALLRSLGFAHEPGWIESPDRPPSVPESPDQAPPT